MSFLPLVDTAADDALGDALARIGPVIRPPPLTGSQVPAGTYVIVEHETSVDLEDVVGWLDCGVEKVIVPVQWAKELIGVIPGDRLMLVLDVANFSAVSDTVRSGVSGVLLRTPAFDLDLISSVAQFFVGDAVHVLDQSSARPSLSAIRELSAIGASVVIPVSQLTLQDSDAAHVNIADAFLAPIVSDRPDGLFPTVVSTQSGHSLGIVYSSRASVRQAIVTGNGVYQSRKHGLWRKGETSGATQDVVSVRLDCDSDAIEFRVVQHGSGFCHLNRHSCFGEITGLPALEKTLQSRLESAPEGSYTKRLFDEPDLLRSKIMEEADELCRASSPEDVAFEAADLIYFALTKCVAAGVSITDIEQSLDRKAKKVTRRSGNAKPEWSSAPTRPVPSTKSDNPDLPISMRSYDLKQVSPQERSQLLRRPVLNSQEMMAKVQPIIDQVRQRGDAALTDLTAKFDRATLTETTIVPPFSPESMELEPSVREAIDIAYANIKKFHAAQANAITLNVETMPGVVCSRFPRPISRVGLYVPGGTAILPSTALMLGVPAQVAGCEEVVLATPPRPDGTVSPEVMYVAHLVGASVVLKAGGAQAVAAMAYGTDTVPKVDKIFGPGNQWVTAAKMVVQNDTDALVSIDMPAGPSEVLVIADHTSNPAYVAADLLSQAEHGVDSQVVLVTVSLSEESISKIEEEVDKQARALSRVEILRESVSKSIIVQTSSVQEAVDFSNDYAPEHLILHVQDASARVADIKNAGSIFVGPFTPESCGDYASGTNHTLPTNGYARQFSGVNTQSFQKHMTSQEITSDGLKRLGPVVATLADCEGLSAHANAVRIRLAS